LNPVTSGEEKPKGDESMPLAERYAGRTESEVNANPALAVFPKNFLLE
jgi:hypothetical protein